MKRHKYDSSVIFLYATGNEHLLPLEFRKKIPYTTISTWRKTDYSEYLGNEFRSYFDEAFQALEIKNKYEELKKTLMSIARSWVSLASTIEPLIKQAGKDKELQRKILN